MQDFDIDTLTSAMATMHVARIHCLSVLLTHH
jgi:hypothetical protein